MAENPISNESLGLEIEANTLKGAELRLVKGTPQIINLFEVAVDRKESTPTNVKLLYNENEKQNFTQLTEKNLVVTSLPTTNVLVRQLEVNLTSDKDIDSVLEFQAEPLIPYPLEEGFLDKITLSKQTESTTLTVIAARKDFVFTHLEQCKSIHIEPEVVTCTPAALASFSQSFCSTETPHLILHLGFDCITCAIIDNGKLVATQSTEKGIGEYDTASDAEREKRLESLLFDIKRITYSLVKQINDKESAGIILTGQGVENQIISNAIHADLDLKTLPLREDPQLSIPEIKIRKYAVPIGSGLSTLNNDFNQINFRQEDLSYPFPLKRIKKPLVSFAILSLCVAAAFYTLGNAYLARQEDQIREEYVSLLAMMKKPYSEFEEKFTGNVLKEDPLNEVTFSVFDLSKEDISHRVNLLEQEIRATPDLFPLLPNTPRVSDVLAWLSTHPHITGENEPDSSGEPRIQLTNFNYKMVKRPEETKKRVKYQVKVDIEFTTPIPRYAREFHDILLAPNEIVDPRGEVKWGTERGKYRASFFLKDKTLYPQ